MLAQDIRQDELVSISTEAQQTWLRNFNPLLNEGSVRWPTHCGVYEPLLIYNVIDWRDLAMAGRRNGSSRADAKTLTFTIREGVKWSDGTPLTAKDVAFTFNLMKEKTALTGGAGGARAVLDGYVTKIEAPDDTTAVFTFSEAFTPGLWDIGETMIVPEHIWKDVEDPVTFTNENPVGTGPFTEIGKFQAQY